MEACTMAQQNGCAGQRPAAATSKTVSELWSVGRGHRALLPELRCQPAVFAGRCDTLAVPADARTRAGYVGHFLLLLPALRPESAAGAAPGRRASAQLAFDLRRYQCPDSVASGRAPGFAHPPRAVVAPDQ